MNLSKQNDNRSITSLLSQMNIGFLILDESGSIIKINNSCANFLGLSDNVAGCSIIELLGAHELVDLIRSKSVSDTSRSVSATSRSELATSRSVSATSRIVLLVDSLPVEVS